MSRYYRECPFCGANLDPGEICDYRDVAEDSGDRVKRPQARFDGLEVTNHRKTKEARSRGFSAILKGTTDDG